VATSPKAALTAQHQASIEARRAPSPTSVDASTPESLEAKRIVVRGRVQGVGFRPFVYRTAQSLGLKGWVLNGGGQVFIHIEGPGAGLARFERLLITEAPPLARPEIAHAAIAAPERSKDFSIRQSRARDVPEIHLPLDLFICGDCLAEMRRTDERRYRYPFINCTQCGPRYTIIGAFPYDRPNTSMARFPLCASCRAEYEDPRDRRFHAEPLACPDCGPTLAFRGERNSFGEAALGAAIGVLRAGGVVAIKGIGGYHLVCDAADDVAVRRLRTRKQRPDKPLAIMVPQRGEDGLAAVGEHVLLSAAEAAACADPARPIVLAKRRADCRLSPALAPGLAELGVFLPYSPLHHLLLDTYGRTLVATSGNISGEPVITDEAEAEARLAAVGDAFLHHTRPILRPADDPVLRVIAGKPRALRLGRGTAPVEMSLPRALRVPVLAVGGHMKVTVALAWGRRAVISPHIGDLDSPRGLAVFDAVVADLQRLYAAEPRAIACDAHPQYASARWAARQTMPRHLVQHHHAHASALAGEHPEIRDWLVFAWDGAGYGTDGTLWGGEALLGGPGRWRRAGSVRPFRLLGGDTAAREPWRSAAALLWETGRTWAPRGESSGLARDAWSRRVNVAESSSVGRLFDAAACLVAGIEQASFEGHGPMMLESLAEKSAPPIALPLTRDAEGLFRFDWEPLLPILADDDRPAALRAGIFHHSLARALFDQARAIARESAIDAVGLTGGVFQNRLLAELVTEQLESAGIPVLMPERLPPNDGGLSFGQIVETLSSLGEAAS
jgi:hydrogenase maturation protein HypF